MQLFASEPPCLLFVEETNCYNSGEVRLFLGEKMGRLGRQGETERQKESWGGDRERERGKEGEGEMKSA